jgi:hypothetical protein
VALLMLPLQGLIKAQWKSALPIAIASIVFPFGIGAAVSPWLQVRHCRGHSPYAWQRMPVPCGTA